MSSAIKTFPYFFPRQVENKLRKIFAFKISHNFARLAGIHLLVKAIQDFNDVKDTVSAENPAMPLILNALGALYEKNNELDKAVASFNELSIYKGFEASSYEAMGRLYEQQGKKDKAVEMYRKALSINPEGDSLQSANPNKETIKARINFLLD